MMCGVETFGKMLTFCVIYDSTAPAGSTVFMTGIAFPPTLPPRPPNFGILSV